MPVKRTGPIVAAIIVALFAAMLVQALVTNPRFEWNVVWKYLFNENVLEGIKYTLLLTVISMVIAIILAVVLAVMRKSINPVLRGVSPIYNPHDYSEYYCADWRSLPSRQDASDPARCYSTAPNRRLAAIHSG